MHETDISQYYSGAPVGRLEADPSLGELRSLFQGRREIDDFQTVIVGILSGKH